MRQINVERADLAKCVSQAQRERLVIAKKGKSVAVLVGGEGQDREQLESGDQRSVLEDEGAPQEAEDHDPGSTRTQSCKGAIATREQVNSLTSGWLVAQHPSMAVRTRRYCDGVPLRATDLNYHRDRVAVQETISRWVRLMFDDLHFKHPQAADQCQLRRRVWWPEKRQHQAARFPFTPHLPPLSSVRGLAARSGVSLPVQATSSPDTVSPEAEETWRPHLTRL
jgi:hypothetical protein